MRKRNCKHKFSTEERSVTHLVFQMIRGSPPGSHCSEMKCQCITCICSNISALYFSSQGQDNQLTSKEARSPPDLAWRVERKKSSSLCRPFLFLTFFNSLCGSEKESTFSQVFNETYFLAICTTLNPRPVQRAHQSHQFNDSPEKESHLHHCTKQAWHITSKCSSHPLKDAPSETAQKILSLNLKEEQREAGDGETSRNAIHSWLNAVPAI